MNNTTKTITFLLIALILTASITPSSAQNVKEDFTCKVALADRTELKRVIASTHFTPSQKINFKTELKTVTALIVNNNCETK